MSMDAEERALVLAAADSIAPDKGPLLILADWYDDHGQASEAYACRWMAHHWVRPKYDTSGSRSTGNKWHQYRLNGFAGIRPMGCYIHHAVCSLYSGPGSDLVVTTTDESKEIAFKSLVARLGQGLQALLTIATWTEQEPQETP